MTDSNQPQSTDSTGEKTQSRRGFLSRSALAGSALVALGGGAGVALADEHTENGDMEASFDDVEGTDIDVLNYALSLEHLEAAFYQNALETFDEEAFVEAENLQGFDEEYRRELYSYVQTIAEHEATHVQVLTQAVELLGGEPAEAAEYEFGLEDIGQFFSLAAVLENTGVAAYAGAAPFVQSPDLLGAALSIHSVEARHAAMMNVLAGASPFPDAFDEASSQSDVLDTVSQFIVEEETPTDDDETDTPEDDETETPTEDGTDTPMGNETDTPTDGTDTPMGNGTDTPTGNGTDPTGTDVPTPNGTAGNGTAGNGTAGNGTSTPNGG